MTPDTIDPTDRDTIEAHVNDHSDRLPPVYAPSNGHPIGDAGVWPGDVLARDRGVYLVVDVTNDDAICYKVGDRRYMTYPRQFIDEDLDEGRLAYHEQVIDPTLVDN